MKASPEAIASIQQQLSLYAIRALIESHPDPASFRESWAHMMGLMTKDIMRSHEGQQDFIEDTNSAMAELLPIWESYFPDSDAARSKPDRR